MRSRRPYSCSHHEPAVHNMKLVTESGGERGALPGASDPDIRHSARTRRAFLKGALASTAILVGAACAPSPTVPAAPTVAAAGGATAAPQKPAGAGDFQAQWDQLIADAKKEGTLVVATAPVPVIRTGILEVFSQKFGVQAQYLGALGSEHANRIQAERSAEQFNLDVWISGQVILFPAYNRGWLDPIKPLLIHPEATTGSNWSCIGCETQGPIPFMDPKNDAILRPVNYTSPAAIYNTQMVKPDELKNFQDLLDPKWKGKIAAYDPVNSAPGQTIARFWWKALGDDFVRTFFHDQKPALTDSNKQLEEWVSRGVYPIVQNLDTDQIERLKKDGLPVEVVPELGGAPTGYVNYVWAAGFMAGLLNKAPHPNASKLFLNWLASKDGIETYAKALSVPAARSDVSNDWVPSYVKPKAGQKYFDVQGWNEFALAQQEASQLKALVG